MFRHIESIKREASPALFENRKVSRFLKERHGCVLPPSTTPCSLHSGNILFAPSYFRYHIQRYWGIFMHIELLLRHTQAYSSMFSTLSIPRIFTTFFTNILTTIFWAVPYLKTVALLKPCETLTRHIQNPAIGRYSAIFMHISEPCAALAYAETWLARISEYSEPFHNYISKNIQKPLKDLRLSFFAKIVKK